MEQTDDEIAEMVARFRTPPSCSWEDLRNDILTIIKSIRAQENERGMAAFIRHPSEMN